LLEAVPGTCLALKNPASQPSLTTFFQAVAMEAIAGLSLAANILQVIDFSAKVLLAGHQIHKTGSTAQNAELELVTNDFVELNDRLRSWIRPDAATSGPLEKDSQVRQPRRPYCRNTNKRGSFSKI
jgi:hypothetical protein